MSKSLATKNIAAVLLGLGLILAMTFAFATPAKAQSISDLQAQINALLAQIASLQGGTSGGACFTFTRNHAMGESGGEIMQIQKFLNGHGAQVSASGAGSPGNETSSFGALSKAAVAKFQSMNGIAPAAGYWGPITRAKANSMCAIVGPPGPPGAPAPSPSGPLQGGEGSLDVNGLLGDVESSLDEGDEDAKVLGLELEAQDSDMMVTRVDVQIDLDDASGGESTQLDDYITEVSLWLGSARLGTIDVDDIEEDSSESDLFEARFSGLNGVIREDDTEDLYVAVTAVNNIDTGDVATQLEVGIDATGIRAVDALGISETYDGGYNGNGSGDLESFTVGASDTGTLTIREGDDNPDAGLVVVDDTTDTDDVLVLEFELEADDQDIHVEDVPVGFTVSGITNVGDAVIRAHLKEGSTVIKTESIVASAGTYEEVVFDNVDLDIENGDKVTYSVTIDVQDTDSGEPDNGDSVTASTTANGIGWDVEDSNGENVTPTGSAGGNAQTFNANAVVLEFVSADESIRVGSIAGDPDIADLTLVFDVTNNGDDDAYVDADPCAGCVAVAATEDDGFFWATTTNSTTGTSTTGTTAVGTPTITADGDTSDDDTTSGQSDFRIDSGETRRITFVVSIPAGGDNVNAGARLTGLNWGTTDADDSMDNLYNFDLGDFKTVTVTGLVIH